MDADSWNVSQELIRRRGALIEPAARGDDEAMKEFLQLGCKISLIPLNARVKRIEAVLGKVQPGVERKGG